MLCLTTALHGCAAADRGVLVFAPEDCENRCGEKKKIPKKAIGAGQETDDRMVHKTPF